MTKRLIPFLSVLILLLALPQSGTAQAQRAPVRDNASQGVAARSAGSRTGAQTDDEGTGDEEEDPCVTPDDHRYCWTQDPITGIHHRQEPDTTHLGLATRETMPGKSLALVHTGNLYSPHLINDFFDRKTPDDFLFVNAYSLFAFRPDELRFYDTRIPYTRAAYTTSGSNVESNDRLRIDFAGNVSRRLGLGTFLDYVYARGEYTSQATKPLRWTSYVYYDDDQYKGTLTFNLSKLANQENGGIMDRSYVLTPDAYNDNYTAPRTMPANLTDTWNDMDSWNLHYNHSYDLGFWDERVNPADSTDLLEEFTSVASIFHSIDFEHYKHIFRMDANADQTDEHNYYANHFVNPTTTLDSTSYANFSTYAGIRLNEGFSRWSQFGLAAFIGFQHQGYTMMQDTLDLAFIERHHSSNNLYIGGQLSRHKYRRLAFDITAKVGISGDKAGDIDISGQLHTSIPAGRRDSITVEASGYFRNVKTPYLLNHYFSNHFRWSESFSPEQRLHLEGRLRYSLTGTEAKVGIEHISNYHYFSADDFLPHEASDMVQVFSLELSQKLHWRALHWDNRVLFQTSTQDHILPLPKISLETDVNLHLVIAHALTLQMGLVGYYNTKYYAPTYQPATQQFAVQRDIQCGGFPWANAYINCNLKRIKFYVMYSGLFAKTFTNDTFLMPYYPVQSPRIEYGVLFDLQN